MGLSRAELRPSVSIMRVYGDGNEWKMTIFWLMASNHLYCDIQGRIRPLHLRGQFKVSLMSKDFKFLHEKLQKVASDHFFSHKSETILFTCEFYIILILLCILRQTWYCGRISKEMLHSRFSLTWNWPEVLFIAPICSNVEHAGLTWALLSVCPYYLYPVDE